MKSTFALILTITLVNTSLIAKPNPVIADHLEGHQQRFDPSTVTFRIDHTGPSLSWGLAGSKQLNMVVKEKSKYYSEPKVFLLLEHGIFISYSRFSELEEQFEVTRDYAIANGMDLAVDIESKNVCAYDVSAVPKQ